MTRVAGCRGCDVASSSVPRKVIAAWAWRAVVTVTIPTYSSFVQVSFCNCRTNEFVHVIGRRCRRAGVGRSETGEV